MPKASRVFLRGTDLYKALRAMDSKQMVKLVVDNKSFSTTYITSDIASVMAKSGHFEGLFRRGKIVRIKSIDPRRPPIHDPKRRIGRPMLQFVPVTKKTVEIWDKYFAHQRQASSQQPASVKTV
jgi:hypothetical protein